MQDEKVGAVCFKTRPQLSFLPQFLLLYLSACSRMPTVRRPTNKFGSSKVSGTEITLRVLTPAEVQHS